MQSKYQQELNQIDRDNEAERIKQAVENIEMEWHDDLLETELIAIESKLLDLCHKAENIWHLDLVFCIEIFIISCKKQQEKLTKELKN